MTCNDNKLDKLDFSGCTQLEELNCSNNNISGLDLSASESVTTLNCSGNPLLFAKLAEGKTLSSCVLKPVKTYMNRGETLDLAALGTDSTRVEDIVRGKLENGVLVLDKCPGKMTYTYDIDGNNKLECTVEFTIPIDEEHFPDEYFRQFITDNYAKFAAGEMLSESEISSVNDMSITNQQYILYFTGIEYFTELRKFEIENIVLAEELDLSKNKKLESIDANTGGHGRGVKKINVKGLDKRKDLNLHHHSLLELDCSGCTSLKKIDCHDNAYRSVKDRLEVIQKLNIYDCTALTYLDCNINSMIELILSKNSSGTDNQGLEIDCHTNEITTIDFNDCNGNNSSQLNIPEDADMNIADIGRNPLYCDKRRK